jgi:SAM-dependent methyltransferase
LKTQDASRLKIIPGQGQVRGKRDRTVQINQNLKDTVCLNCRNVGTFSSVDGFLRCPSCNHDYLLFGNIPILLKDSRLSLAASHQQHQSLIDFNEDRLEEIRDAKGRQPDRAVLSSGIHAYETDNRYLKLLQNEIEAHVPKSTIDEMVDDGRLPRQYRLSEGIAFFHRDWSWLERAEDEIATILETVFAQVDRFADDVDSVLIPGAGAGRFAFEMAGKYDNCLAFDYSIYMAQIFYDLLQGDLSLHRVNFRSNVINTEDVVVEYKLSLDAPGSTRIKSQLKTGNLSYFVGTALDVPLPGNSLSAIACLYFIDIVPLKEHLNEIRRMLKPGGLFINFGPLRYMRGDVANMLSGEEILSLFKESGFDILHHDIVTNTQLASSPVITITTSHNFMFVARKR